MAVAVFALGVVTAALLGADARLEHPETDGRDAGVMVLPHVDVPMPAEALPTSPTRRDPSGTISIIDAHNRPAESKDVAELVLAAPGAAVQDTGGAGQRKTLSLRGSNPNAVLVLLDGVPLSAPGHGLDLSRISTAIVERLEVLRGAASGRYGPGAMGGVVNLVSRPPNGTRLFGTLTQGSFATTLGSVGGSTRLGRGEGLLLLHGLQTAGEFTYLRDPTPVFGGDVFIPTQRTNNAAVQGGGLLRYRVPVGAGGLDVLGEGAVERRGLAGTSQNPTPDSSHGSARGTASARLSLNLGGGELSAFLYGRLDDSTLVGGSFGPALRQLESALGGEVVFTRLFGARHGFTALVAGGGDWLSEPSGTNPSSGRVGAMVGEELFLFDGAVALNASVRVDLAGPFVSLSPKAGARVELPYGLELKANVGQASRPPSFIELYLVQGTLLPNPKLRPERALTADATAAVKRDWASAEVTAFASLYEDLITYEYYPPFFARPFNFQAASVAGLEAEAAVRPARWMELTASYTFLSTANLRDDPRFYMKALPYRPAHRVHARLVAGVPLLALRAEVLAQGEQFQNRTQTLSLPARAFLAAGASSAVELSNQLRLTFGLEVKNLLDVQSQDMDGYPLPPRAVSLTIAAAWDAVRASQ